jgi:hypothetical protein
MSGRSVSRVLESALAPDLKFTAAVFASFADDDGFMHPSIGHVAYLRGLEARRVQYHVKELRAMAVFELVRPATQWHATSYRIAFEKLPGRAPYKPPERQRWLLGALPDNPGVHSGAPPPGVHSTAAGVHPSAPDPSDDPSVHTRTARARESAVLSEVQPAAPLETRLPLLPVWRDPGHRAHTWCVRICVPKFLHKQFKDALGGPVTKKPERLRAFYAETIAAIPSTWDIGDEPVKFWRGAFARRFGRVTVEDDRRRRPGDIPCTSGCHHDPPCTGSFTDCIARTIAEGRAKRQQTG